MTKKHLCIYHAFRCAKPEWRNWYTHQTQNLARFTPHVGSSPTSGTKNICGFPFDFRKTAFLLTSLKISCLALFAQRAPFTDADETKRERVLSFDEEIRLLEACEKRRAHLRPLIITAVDTAMQRGELFKLQWKDIDLASQTITVTAMNSKTTKARTIAMTPRVQAELETLWNKSPKDGNGLVFGITDTVKRSFAGACKDANINGLRFHDLRHTSITKMIQAGITPMEVMKISGHTQMMTLRRRLSDLF